MKSTCSMFRTPFRIRVPHLPPSLNLAHQLSICGQLIVIRRSHLRILSQGARLVQLTPIRQRPRQVLIPVHHFRRVNVS